MTEAAVEPQLTLGATIKQARDANKLSIRELADSLKLPQQVIASLEEDDYASLPSAAFVKGYLRSIALQLKLDPAALIELYRPPVNEEELNSTKTAQTQRQYNDPLIKWTGAAMLLLLVAFLIYFIQSHTDDELKTATVEPDVKQLLSEKISSEKIAATVLPELVVTYSATTQSMATESVSTTVVDEDAKLKIAPAVGDDRLRINATAQTWVEIKDANNKQILFGMLEKTDKPIVLSGAAPFDLFFGNATVVTVDLNGRQFAHQQYIRNNKVARFTIK